MKEDLVGTRDAHESLRETFDPRLVDGRYRVLRPLGSGGMAEVYLARDEKLGREVALKVLSRRYAGDVEFVERFEREARSAASLSHPNIVSIYDRGETPEGACYIAMEYLPGGTLRERGKPSPREAAKVATQVAKALEASHRRGVIHRDIKPENVLITASGDAKVADFGIARSLSLPTLTGTDVVMGSAHYMAPERLAGRPEDHRSDLYSLGVVFYEMLAGEPPVRYVTGEIIAPRDLSPEVPRTLSDIIVRLLATDPSGRYPDATRLIEALERTSESPSSLPEPPGRKIPHAPPVRHTKRTVKRRKTFSRLLLAAALVALLALGAGWGLARYEVPTGDPEPPEVVDAEPPDGGDDAPEPAPGVVLPNLSGEDARGAVSTLVTEYGVATGVRVEESTEPAGTVLYTEPAAGSRVERGDEVILIVSAGIHSDTSDNPYDRW